MKNISVNVISYKKENRQTQLKFSLDPIFGSKRFALSSTKLSSYYYTLTGAFFCTQHDTFFRAELATLCIALDFTFDWSFFCPKSYTITRT